jgi:hypothetical protein
MLRQHLEKAKSIAELRSPTRDDGTITRILWMLGRVKSENLVTAAAGEKLKDRAEIARKKLVKDGEGAPVDIYEQDGNLEPEDYGILYDALVPVFFR